MGVALNDPRIGLPSASKLERVAACPGSHAMEERVKDDAPDDSTEITEVGLRVHKARETSNTLELNPEEFELYQSGLRYEERLLEKWKSTWGFKDDDVKQGPNELRLWIHNHNLDPVGSGQLDVHFLCREYAHIIDWKVGFLNHLVGATGNYQLRMQAVLLWLEHPHLKNIRVAFAKPRYEESELDFVDYSEMDLHYSYESIILAIWWATQPDAVRSPGLHCRYCKAKSFCPQAVAFALLPSTIASGILSGKKAGVAVEAVTPDDLARIWEASSTIESILKAVKDRLKSFSDEELAALGIRRGKGRETLTWKDVEGAFGLLKEKGWNEMELWMCLEFGLGKLGKLAEKYMGVGEKYANGEVKQLLAQFIEIGEGEKILRKAR
jgi:hypothetical protein